MIPFRHKITVLGSLLCAFALSLPAFANDSLAKDMQRMSADFKVLNAQLKDPAKNASSLQAADDMQLAVTDAAALVPDPVASLPADQKAAQLAVYQSLMDELNAKLAQIVSDLNQNDNSAATAALVEIGGLKSHGHSLFNN